MAFIHSFISFFFSTSASACVSRLRIRLLVCCLYMGRCGSSEKGKQEGEGTGGEVYIGDVVCAIGGSMMDSDALALGIPPTE